MNTLLIYFAFPIAVIIASVILQKLLNNPILVASFIFAIFLIVTFAAFDETFLIATLGYTIISFITAIITKLFCNNQEQSNFFESCLCNLVNNNTQDNNSTVEGTRASKNNEKCFDYTYNKFRHF